MDGYQGGKDGAHELWLQLMLFSCKVVSDSLHPGGLQHDRLPCPLLSPGVCPHSCWLNRWCHPTISSSVAPFSACHQSFPASRSLTMSQPKYWSFSFSISLSSEYSGLIYFKIDWFDLLAVQGTLKSVWKHQFFSTQPSLWSSSCIHAWLLEKP